LIDCRTCGAQRGCVYLADVDLVADAVETVCKLFDPAYRRINVEVLGNTGAFLHCHV
jgi:hypothetical protein